MSRKKKTEEKTETIKMRLAGGLVAALALAMNPAAGIAAESVTEQLYVFRMEITRDVPARTFVIGDFGEVKRPRPPAEIPVARKNKAFLSLRKRETSNMDGKQTGNAQPHFAETEPSRE